MQSGSLSNRVDVETGGGGPPPRAQMKKLIAVIAAGLIAFFTLSCGGGGGSGNGGGGGGGSDIADAYAAFPSFNESGLTIQHGSAAKYYYHSSTTTQNAIDDFGNLLLQRGFTQGASSNCADYNDYYKIGGDYLACVETDEGGDFNVDLIKNSAPTDAEFNDVFGSSIPGDRYYTERLLAATPNAAFTSAVSSYNNVLQSASFTCAIDSYNITHCRKTVGDLYYEVAYGIIDAYGIIYWGVFVTGGIVNSEPYCTVDTNTNFFDANDYAGNPNALFALADPLAVYQWHLKNFGQKSGSDYLAKTSGEDINVTSVWGSNTKGNGVTIGIVDTGTDFTHPDLKPAYKKDLSYNYYSRSNNPYPVSISDDYGCSHGTMTAGIAGARGSNGGVMGVAPQANLAGLNIGLGCGFYPTYADLPDALYSASRAIDVSSNSWGSSAPTPDSDNEVLENAIIEGAESGRGGKGTIYVFAAGNDRAHNANGNYDSTQSLFQSISVAA
ncbi:MAG: S8 family serine peptidase, partial [Helicobacteraceae bacterium]|nr:S8 family serine peptidase [Helicobacteraceae bacterium]